MKSKVVILGLGGMLLFSIPLLSQYAPFYVLDGYGGVHAGGGAPVISPATPYFGFNIAKDIAYVPVATSISNYGDGLLVLDGYGGVHKGGKLSTVSVTATPYFGWDIARAIAFRRIDPQAAKLIESANYDITTTSWNWETVLGPVTMYLPDSGQVLVILDVEIQNTSASSIGSGAFIYGQICIGNNSTTTEELGSTRTVTLGDKTVSSWAPEIQMSSSVLVNVSAGQNNFYLLGRRPYGTGTMRFTRASISCVYINKRYDTYSLSSPKSQF